LRLDQSGTARGFPAHSREQSKQSSQAFLDQDQHARTLSVDRLGARIARASEEELAGVLDGLNEIFG
jgi:hypothetical protein